MRAIVGMIVIVVFVFLSITLGEIIESISPGPKAHIEHLYLSDGGDMLERFPPGTYIGMMTTSACTPRDGRENYTLWYQQVDNTTGAIFIGGQDPRVEVWTTAGNGGRRRVPIDWYGTLQSPQSYW